MITDLSDADRGQGYSLHHQLHKFPQPNLPKRYLATGYIYINRAILYELIPKAELGDYADATKPPI